MTEGSPGRVRSSAMPNSSDSLFLLLEGLTVGSSCPSGPSLLVFLFLLLVYLFVVISNLSITVLILLKRSLHQPVYLLYLNLSINDLLGNTTVIPRLLVDLLRPASLRHIHLYSCVVQAFFTLMFSTTGHTILMIMAFDRYMAICSPLRYSAIMSGRTMVKLTVWAWSIAFLFVSVLLGLTLRLTRCRYLVSGLYCNNASLFKLSCENTYINNVYGLFFTVILFSSSIGSIVVTYTKITVVCLMSKSASLNRKALQTCSTHLFSYLLFLCSGLLIIIFHRFPHLVQERKFITVMYHLLPSSINPLIYGVQSKDIRRSFSELMRKGSWDICPTSSYVVCGPGEGVKPCPSKCPLEIEHGKWGLLVRVVQSLITFFTHLFSTTGHTILMIMAFDRYMAICCPLHYSAIMSGRTVVKLTVWANVSLFKLSCENTYINNIYGLFFTAIVFSGSIGSIVVTYTKITVVCLTSKSASLNRKALQTCSTHLFSYLLFLGCGMLIVIFHRFPHLVQERKFITIMFHLLPSSLNPLIYGVQSKEIRRSFSALVSKVSFFS
ncbi:hypothetical protein WMY93_028376 [Mugilogobius chulae]|uniref:G-protein coupled receptors family 1 profile domain-containing protein n=1 Tax=Mugilogobius chulae TaxID=88201 RepID=A0AAW0MN43_9GOBI